MSLNYSKLRGKIKECGLTQESLASKSGMNPATLSAKLTGRSYFTVDEILCIASVLEIPKQSISEYFFTV